MADPADVLGLRQQPPHEYGPTPPVRWSQPWSDRRVAVLTAIGALLVGFLFVSGIRASRAAVVQANERKAELIALIEARQARSDELAGRLEALRQRVTDAEAAATAGLPALRHGLDVSEAAAGLTPVAGPGLRITFADAEGTCAQGPDSCRILDRDLQDAVNTLFGLGAEAVAINGERVIATSAIRNAGQAVLVNFRVLTSPYVVEAIGDPAQLERELAASQLGADFSAWSQDYGLGYTVEPVQDLELPAFGGSLRLKVAAPADDSPVGAP